ncbi:MAG: DHH family phosphoesterase, partial [Actinoallomurus sp.]
YVGLITDTGSFKYAATTPDVHELAGRLLATGIRPESVAREVWDRAPFGYLPVLSAALGRATLEPEVAGGLGMVWTTVTRADRAACGLPYDLIEGVIDIVRRTDEAELAVVFKEDDEGAWQVSTRSKGRVDVGLACVALGGGGHPGAAGFTLHGDVAHAVQQLRELFAQIEVATRS